MSYDSQSRGYIDEGSSPPFRVSRQFFITLIRWVGDQPNHINTILLLKEDTSYYNRLWKC